jgi:FkbM family methyltransferase
VPYDHVDRYLYVYGEYESATVKLLNRILEKGECFIDIGANIGVYTTLAAKLVGSMGTVYSFEPSPSVSVRLRETAVLNSLKNVVLMPVAVSDRNTTVAFYQADEKNSGKSGLFKSGSPGRQTNVLAMALDSMAGVLPPVKMIKIDIEGSEVAALRGMRGILLRDKPFLLVELSDANLKPMGSSSSELCAVLSELGYRIFDVAEEVTEVTSPPQEQVNVLCVHSEMVASSAMNRVLAGTNTCKL